MFRSDGYFAQRHADTGAMEWFFYTREGVQGPYPSKAHATATRAAYVETCRARGLDGGRKARPLPSVPDGRTPRAHVG